MRSRGRLASVLAAMAMATVLGMPAAAGALGNAEDAATPAPASGQATAGAEPQPVGTDDASADEATDGVAVVRYVGADPYEQSLKIARALVDAGDGSSEWVVLTSGGAWADAVAAGPLAASLGAPVVLVPPGGLQSPTARPDLVEFLRSTRARRVVIVGSPDVLPNHEPSVLFGLGMLPRNIERVYDDDPVGTSIAVAKRIGTPAKFGELGRTVIIASDRSVADAVAVGSLAASGPFPLLLTAPDALDQRISAYLAEHEVTHVVLVGGTSAIAPAVQEAVETADIAVTRLAGRDRSDTARLAADLFEQHTADDPECANGPTRIGLAPAQHPEPALTAGPLLAELCSPLRYTEPGQLPTDLRNTLYLAAHGSPKVLIRVFGDRTSISDASMDVSVPPIRLAVVGRLRIANTDRYESVVLIVDENGRRSRHRPVFDRDRSSPGSGFSPDQFTWSPDGTRLAVASSGRLLVLNAESGEFQEATVGDHAFRYLPIWHWPEWSPDSTRVVFTAFVDDPATCRDGDCGDDPYSNRTAEMFMYDTATGTTSRLTHNDINDTVRSWSPDGTRIAFTRSDVDMGIFARYWYPESLHVMDLADRTVTNVYEHAQSVGEVWWAPDGRHLAFRGTIEAPLLFGDHRAFLATTDGNAVQQLTPDPSSQESTQGWVTGWSPNGRFVAHGRTRHSGSGASTDIQYVYDVTNGVNASFDLSIDAVLTAYGWSRDGTKLLYMQYPPRPQSQRPLALISVNPLNGDVERLVEVPTEIAWNLATAIAADASQVAFIDDELQFALVGNSWSGLRSQVDISFHIPVDGFPLCELAWAINGIRGNCAVYYDF